MIFFGSFPENHKNFIFPNDVLKLSGYKTVSLGGVSGLGLTQRHGRLKEDHILLQNAVYRIDAAVS